MNITVSFDPVDGLGHSNGHFGVVQDQSNHDIRLSIFTINWACSPQIDHVHHKLSMLTINWACSDFESNSVHLLEILLNKPQKFMKQKVLRIIFYL